jgi:hypothetical protein
MVLAAFVVPPVERDRHLVAGAQDEADEVAQGGVDLEAIVAQEPMELLDRVFRARVARDGCRPTDGRDAGLCRVDGPEDRVGQRDDAAGMESGLGKDGRDGLFDGLIGVERG